MQKMSEKEAIERIKATPLMRYDSEYAKTSELGQSLHMAIQALEEIQQYRTIGTVEEFKVLKGKEERFDRNIKMFNSIGLKIRANAITEFAQKAIERLEELNCEAWERDVMDIAEQMIGGAE